MLSSLHNDNISSAVNRSSAANYYVVRNRIGFSGHGHYGARA